MKVCYPIASIVSVWVGSFESENEFDQCTDGPITRALGLNVELASICEVAYETHPVPIRKLIEGFSGWESFAGAVENIAAKRGILNANAALVCYYVRCDGAPPIWDRLHFLGSVQGHDV